MIMNALIISGCVVITTGLLIVILDILTNFGPEE